MPSEPQSDSPDVAGARDIPSQSTLSFRVSTGLKRVLGRELITNDEVAIFELVKNSFDAGARHVDLYFGDDEICIVDDGSGMTLDDIKNKWLFVAYSAKRNRTPSDQEIDYREAIADRQHYAGSKGVGRFSSDRLGKFLTLQTRHQSNPLGIVHRLVIDWVAFEANDADQFETIRPQYSSESMFLLPNGIALSSQGTAITISGLESQWDRDRLIKLKRGLAKLINPFGTGIDDFEITILAPSEVPADHAALQKSRHNGTLDEQADVEQVNGRVGNFIFRTLEQKTTFLTVAIDPTENKIVSALVDRGEEIYRISEANPYRMLRSAGFRCQIFYLNQSAKSTFTRRMGLEPVKFGSVFLFKNEFRVFPIGEEDDDWFGLDRRKQQGYNRFLGTRELIGRIDVSGDDQDFQEASSRNQGLIATEAVHELRQCFRDHCLKRLERYVVPVNWGLANDKLTDTLEVLETERGRIKVAAAVASLVGSEDVTVLSYSRRLIDVVEERAEGFQQSLGALKVIAQRIDDRDLHERIQQAEARFAELKAIETEARRIADEERQAKEEAEERAARAEAEAAKSQEELAEERKRILFLTSLSSIDVDTLNNLHHQITIYSTSLQSEVNGLIERLTKKLPLSNLELITRLESIALSNRRIHAVARFATKANFRLESEYIDEDLALFISSYAQEILPMFAGMGLHVSVTTDGKSAKRKFKPIDLSIVVDNLMSNAKKAGATKLDFSLNQTNRGVLQILATDDGNGVDKSLLPGSRLFEKGVSKTDGSGLGLYHVRQVLGDMGGTIEVAETSASGTTFDIQIPL
jgi:signal transduction histidine kinase